MNFDVKYKVEGIYDKVEIIGKDGEVKKSVGPFKNLILDAGLHLMGTDNRFTNHFYYGTGNTPPTVADQDMEAYVGHRTSTESNSSNNDEASNTISLTKTWLSDPMSADVIIAELGIGYSPNASTRNIFSRSLVKDAQGNPITLEMLEGESIRATYTLVMHLPESDVHGSFMMHEDGVDTNVAYVARPYLLSNTGRWSITNPNTFSVATAPSARLWKGDLTAAWPSVPPPSSTNYAGSVSMAPYDPVAAPFQVRGSVTSSPTQSNVPAGFDCMRLSLGIGCWQFKLDKDIVKTNDFTMIMNFSASWGRYE